MHIILMSFLNFVIVTVISFPPENYVSGASTARRIFFPSLKKINVFLTYLSRILFPRSWVSLLLFLLLLSLIFVTLVNLVNHGSLVFFLRASAAEDDPFGFVAISQYFKGLLAHYKNDASDFKTDNGRLAFAYAQYMSVADKNLPLSEKMQIRFYADALHQNLLQPTPNALQNILAVLNKHGTDHLVQSLPPGIKEGYVERVEAWNKAHLSAAPAPAAEMVEAEKVAVADKLLAKRPKAPDVSATAPESSKAAEPARPFLSRSEVWHWVILGTFFLGTTAYLAYVVWCEYLRLQRELELDLQLKLLIRRHELQQQDSWFDFDELCLQRMLDSLGRDSSSQD